MLEAKALNPWNEKVNSFETNYWEMTNECSTIALKLKSGYSYQFENDVLKNIARIDLMDSDFENKDTLLQHKCFVCKKCTQVKVIQDDAEQLYKQECVWMNDGEALLKVESTPLRKVFCQEQKLIHFKLFCIYRDDC